ncbi:MAG TPA: MarR family transcriptional regulator [Terrimesophilobacter sp.]|nr:MarR family transcriptional regulator [Terrimesophilobacter sp.]
MNDTQLLADLLVAAHRLTRIAAHSTGNTTPSAVWHTLSILSTDGQLRIGELATAARVSQPSMTKVVQHLVDNGYSERIPDPEDSRASLVSVTPAGIQALAEWRTALATELGSLFSGISAADRTALTRVVHLLGTRTAAKPTN